MPKRRMVCSIGGSRRLGTAPKVRRAVSCRIIDRPKVATMESAAALRIGWITTRWMIAPSARPISGANRKASQKLPVICTVAHATMVPTMKKSPCAMLMMSSRPKMMDRPSAIRAMINPQTRPFIASSSSISMDSSRRDRDDFSPGREVERHDMLVHLQLLGCQPECQPDELRQVDDRQSETRLRVPFHVGLVGVEHRMTERAGSDDGGDAIVPGVLQVLADQLDRHGLFVSGGMEAAAFGAARIVDRSRAEDRVQLLQRLVVARVEEAVMAGRTGDMAAVEGAHVQAGERPLRQ